MPHINYKVLRTGCVLVRGLGGAYSKLGGHRASRDSGGLSQDSGVEELRSQGAKDFSTLYSLLVLSISIPMIS